MQSRPAPRAWVPHFICGAVDDALRWSGIEVSRYALDPGRGVPASLSPGPQDWVVCVDYFGLHADACASALDRFGAHRLLVDASQSLFHTRREHASVVYSPRKFVGVADGGILVTPVPLPSPVNADEEGTVMRSRHLSARANGDVSGGYRLFQEAEASLAFCGPAAMSARTRHLLAAIAWNEVRARRIANYQHLAKALAAHAFQSLVLPETSVPLCCPVAVEDAATLRQRLAEKGIFTPAYWPDAVLPPGDVVGLELRDRMIYLPCDQRYGESDMQRVVEAVVEHGERR